MGNSDKSGVPLKTWERWLYGGVGSLAPVAVTGAAADFVAVFSQLTIIVFLGWCARVIVLFTIGGFVSFLHKNETSSWRAFVIGISAPALLTTYIAGDAASEAAKRHPLNQSSSQRGEISAPINRGATPISFSHIPRRTFCIPQEEVETTREQFSRGFWGFSELVPISYWPLVSGPFDSEDAAVDFIETNNVIAFLPDQNLEDIGFGIYKLSDRDLFIVVLARPDKVDDIFPKFARSVDELRENGIPAIWTSLNEILDLLSIDRYELPICSEFE